MFSLINDLFKRDTVAFISWPEHTFNLHQQNCWSVTGSRFWMFCLWQAPTLHETKISMRHICRQWSPPHIWLSRYNREAEEITFVSSRGLSSPPPHPPAPRTGVISQPLCKLSNSTRKLRSRDVDGVKSMHMEVGGRKYTCAIQYIQNWGAQAWLLPITTVRIIFLILLLQGTAFKQWQRFTPSNFSSQHTIQFPI